MAINLYKPWWVQTTHPFEIEEQEIVYPDNLLDLDSLASLIEENVPELWDLAGIYDVTQSQIETNPETGESSRVFPAVWTEDMQEVLQNPAQRAMYLLDQYEPLSPLKEQSAFHNLDISFNEKYRYSVDEAFESGQKVGVPAMVASGARLAKEGLEAIDTFSEQSISNLPASISTILPVSALASK